ncbi:MAG: GNAT family N-acetyltransferase [Candidatus Kariarchaeaceae archaeon]|jgi:ribosomal-protein-alanine N-acetyltransferase
MADKLIIREPRISDLEDIVHINRKCLPENYPVAYFIELIKSWHATSTVAELEGKVVAYNIVRIEKSSLTPWRSKSASKGHVISIAVMPEYRRMGIGKKMMLDVMDKLKMNGSVKKITLEVRESNSGAIGMYKTLNFISAKILSHYYSDGENAILMELKTG